MKKKAISVILHDAGMELTPRHNDGIFQAVHFKRYEVGYILSEALLKLLRSEFLGMNNLKEEDLHFEHSYQPHPFSSQLAAIFAEVVSPGLLELELHWSPGDDQSVDFKEYLTHSGPFTISWENENIQSIDS